jgi:hypothetical protein
MVAEFGEDHMEEVDDLPEERIDTTPDEEFLEL